MWFNVMSFEKKYNRFFICPFAGKIVASIPWTSLYSMPVVLNVEDVYVLAAPLNDGGYDSRRDAALQNAIKRKKLADLEQPQAGDQGELVKVIEAAKYSKELKKEFSWG